MGALMISIGQTLTLILISFLSLKRECDDIRIFWAAFLKTTNVVLVAAMRWAFSSR